MSRRAANRSAAFDAPRARLAAIARAALLIFCAAAVATPQQSHGPAATAGDFPPELAALLELYRDGRYTEVIARGIALADAAPDVRLRREARAVAALGLMRSPERKAREQGRAMLAELVVHDASLGDRPECLLALGDAHAGLHETAAALECLSAAADGFIAAGRSQRAAEALVLLAETWAAHAEWERMPPHLGVPVPAGPAAAAQTRIARVRAVRARLAALPDSAAAVARVDCTLAGLLLQTPDNAAEGVALLDALLQRGGDAADRAAMNLAEHAERHGGEERAAELYESLAAGNSPLAAKARQRVVALRRPDIELDLPAQLAPGQPLAPAIRTRNTTRVQFELRRIALRAWLDQHRGRLDEGQLPESASSLAVESFESSAPRPLAWWSAAPQPFAPDAGAYVAIARGSSSGGAETIVKRLLIVSPLRAALFAGRTQLLIWCTSQDLGAPPVESAEARFWVQGAFVPRRASMQHGLARMPMPGEARVLTERNWSCLVEAGGQLALCNGVLPSTPASSSDTLALVAVSSLRPQADRGLDIAGWLLDRNGGLPNDAPDRGLSLELRDVNDLAHFRTSLTTDACGAFVVHVPISAALRARNLSVALLDGAHVVPTIGRPPNIAVPDRPDSLGAVRFDLPLWGASRDHLSADLAVEFPWGYRAAVREADVAVRAIQAADAALLARTEATSILRSIELNDVGSTALDFPLADLDVFDEYAALSLTCATRTRDGLYARRRADTLRTPRRLDLWISVEPPDPRVGETCAVEVVSRDWQSGEALGLPSLTLTADGQTRAVDVTPAGPHRSVATWRAGAAGTHEFKAECAASDGDAIVTAAKVVTVQPDAPPDPRRRRTPRITVQPGADGANLIVQISGRDDRPLLLLTENGEPLSAAPLGPLRGLLECTLRSPPAVEGPVQVTLAALGSAGVEVLASADVARGGAQRSIVVASPPAATTARAPTSFDVSVPAQSGLLLARWVSAGGADFDSHVPRPSLVNSSGLSAWPRDPADVARRPAEPPAFVPQHLLHALGQRESLRLDSAAIADGSAHLATVAPHLPGAYALELLARGDDGTFWTHRLPVRVDADVAPLVSVPPMLSVGDRISAAFRTVGGAAPAWGAGLAEVATGSGATPASAPSTSAPDLQFAALEATTPGVYAAELSSPSGDARCVYEVRSAAESPFEYVAASLAPSAALNIPAMAHPRGGLSPIALDLFVERDLAEAVVDVALSWLDEPTEGTAWNALCLDWSAALLRLRPDWDARPVAEILSQLSPGVLGRERIAAAGRITLEEFRNAALARLCATGERDGGWSAWPGGVSDLESTCLACDAILAAAPPDSPERGALRLATSWLRQRAASTDTPLPGRLLAAACLADESDDAQRAELLAMLDRSAADPVLTDADRVWLALALNRLGQAQRAAQLWRASSPTALLDRAWHAAVGLELPHAAGESSRFVAELLAARDSAVWDTLAASAWLIRIASESARDDQPATPDGIVTCTDSDRTIELRHDARQRVFRLPSLSAGARLQSDVPLAVLVRCPVQQRAAASTALPLRIVRELMLATPIRDSHDHVEWKREPYVDGMSVPPECFISVNDTYELPGDLAQVEIRQRAPSLFHFWQGVAQPTDQIGRAYRRDSYVQVNVAERLPAGFHRLEYLVVGVRRGACLLPPPELRVAGRVLPTQVVCPVSRLIVSE
ncbi:MAG: hypothetical protein CHACPFDD_01894 [Phycisphaerae bacterium]|nr:hypothetical protein [Phycisphaerae bacterium]